MCLCFLLPFDSPWGLRPKQQFFFSVTVDSYHNYSWPLHNFKNHGKDYFTSQLKHSAPPSSFFVPYFSSPCQRHKQTIKKYDFVKIHNRIKSLIYTFKTKTKICCVKKKQQQESYFYCIYYFYNFLLIINVGYVF